MTLDTAKIAEYARLRRVQAARTAEADAAKDAANLLEQELIELMTETGTTSHTVDGTLVYMETRVAANKRPEVPTEDFHTALVDAGLEDFVKPTVSAQTLAAYARELDDTDVPMPEALREVINVHYIPKLKTKKAAASRSRKRTAGLSPDPAPPADQWQTDAPAPAGAPA